MGKKSEPKETQKKEADILTADNPIADTSKACDSNTAIKSNLDNLEELFSLIYSEEDINKLKDQLIAHVRSIIDKYDVSENYHILFLYDGINSINENMTDKIYAAIPENNKKPILLIIHSTGGQIEPAYLISKTCKENSPKFVVAIPRRAKSAATLISIGAKEIHMGSMSELGPIDPQFGSLPALGLRSSLETIAKVVSEYPKSSEMFASYLNMQLNIRILGYFERVSESAKQYAQRLLEGMNTPKDIQEIAHALVYEYKDHSFVIDKEEAAKYLGEAVKVNTNEYKLANDIHKFMSNLNLISEYLRKKNIIIVGSHDNMQIVDIPTK